MGRRRLYAKIKHIISSYCNNLGCNLGTNAQYCPCLVWGSRPRCSPAVLQRGSAACWRASQDRFELFPPAAAQLGTDCYHLSPQTCLVRRTALRAGGGEKCWQTSLSTLRPVHTSPSWSSIQARDQADNLHLGFAQSAGVLVRCALPAPNPFKM